MVEADDVIEVLAEDEAVDDQDAAEGEHDDTGIDGPAGVQGVSIYLFIVLYEELLWYAETAGWCCELQLYCAAFFSQ